ncbi:hypothetical protein Glove_642g32 [Diversispora epigaea]|uniref:Serine-threonine/tyrosine-protein kinase catalytic domain-containing protein n=1 Tax=Diversispora epigaea TaxID=1348612 RepID=A0A397G5Q6_9GLOM|nr:hypothetical protein Glove_642g32 [Diversispora epigaea]
MIISSKVNEIPKSNNNNEDNKDEEGDGKDNRDNKKTEGGFGTIYYARWINGKIKEWVIKNQQWEITRIIMRCWDIRATQRPTFKELNEELGRNTIVPYYDVPHDRDLARQICNGLRPKILFHTPKLITRIIMKCWDARVAQRPTSKELRKELTKYRNDYRENEYKNNNEITIQINNAKKFSKNKPKERFWKLIRGNSTTITPLNYQTHPEAIYTSRLLNYSSLPKPKNEKHFEKEFEELIKSTSALSVVASGSINMHAP